MQVLVAIKQMEPIMALSEGKYWLLEAPVLLYPGLCLMVSDTAGLMVINDHSRASPTTGQYSHWSL